MPSIVVNDKGHILSYEDSGSPVNDSKTSYTTLILFHGTGFHGGKLIVVCLNKNIVAER